MYETDGIIIQQQANQLGNIMSNVNMQCNDLSNTLSNDNVPVDFIKSCIASIDIQLEGLISQKNLLQQTLDELAAKLQSK